MISSTGEFLSSSPYFRIHHTDSPGHLVMQNRFHIALSFPGEHRDFVLQVAQSLADEVSRDRVFYDEWYEVELLGVGGDLKLQSMYEQADLVVPFFSEHYSKPWCSLEWEAIRAILLDRRADDGVIPVHMDETSIRGWSKVNFGIRVRNRTPQQIAGLLLDALAHRRRFLSMESRLQSQQSAIESQKQLLEKQQEIINKLVVYSMAFFYFERLKGLNDALSNGTEYIFHKGDSKDLEYLRDNGYIEILGIRQLDDGQDISKIVKLTAIGKYYVQLRMEYDRQASS